MKESLKTELKRHFKASTVEQIENIQSLWSGYGKLVRIRLQSSSFNYTVIAKIIQPPTEVKHPRGWHSTNSHSRKLNSYKIEEQWYRHWSQRCDDSCRIPKFLHYFKDEDTSVLILEDLDASGFASRRSSLDLAEVKLGLKWLANFHGRFLSEKPSKLWEQGSYWHLATRKDEFNAMKDGFLKERAVDLDLKLRGSRFQTIIHGDAKVANFCFSEDMQALAAVDFQYVGGGCGMTDVAYFLGSCLSEKDCELGETDCLKYYFQELHKAVQKDKLLDFETLENDWRGLYPIAWADFMRFLEGWMPSHQKVNEYSRAMVNRAMTILSA